MESPEAPVPNPVPQSDPASKRTRSVYWAAIAVGTLYGIFARICFTYKAFDDLFGVMTGAFIFGMPLCLGFISAYLAEAAGPISWPARLLAPFLPVLCALGVALIFALEGIICIFLWLPAALFAAAVGGSLGYLVRLAIQSRGLSSFTLASFFILPFAVAPLEHQLELQEQRREVTSSIDIRAPREIVWQNIIRVPRFTDAEHHTAWVHRLGFPRPVEATLSAEGVGGVRHASFEGDVVFVETITRWDALQRLTFSIDADPGSIPQTSLDEHVTVGGPYFDVLEGDYRLEPRTDGIVRLHLSSVHRLSTRFNFYSSLWTDFIMQDVQTYILAVVKQRCEAAAARR